MHFTNSITGVNSHTGVGYFKTDDTAKPQLFMFCQADPKEYTQGFKMAVQWRNGSMLFVDDGKNKKMKRLYLQLHVSLKGKQCVTLSYV